MASGLARFLLTGEHHCLLDDKGRLNFPAKMRDKMGESFLIAPWVENCLVAIPEHKLEKVAELLDSQIMSDTRDGGLSFFSRAEDVTPDKQGRILLSQKLRDYIHLDKDVVVVGAGMFAEIWRPDEWEEHKATFDNKQATAASLKKIGL